MEKRNLLIWIFLFSATLLLLLPYGCSTADTVTPLSTTPTTASSSPEITNTPTKPPEIITTPPHDNELYFEELWVAFFPSRGTIEDIPPYIFIITNAQSQLPDGWKYYTSDPNREKCINVEDVDFSNNFILVVSMGIQSVTGPKITVESIWQEVDTIYVQANFDLGGPTYQPMYSEPTRSVRISKDNMTRFGEITFILLDQEGEERARAVCEIPE